MDFLDNLENSLKNLEGREERDSSNAERRIEAQKKAGEIAPWAAALKNSPYVQQLFEKAALTGHRLRSKIYIAWLDNVLRLEMKGRTCEIRPTAHGIEYEFASAEGRVVRKPLDLVGDPEKLLNEWLDPINQEKPA